MPEEFAPPVVAVVATADPGGWFEECLASLGAQDYPSLDVLVIDDASLTDLTSRVAAVLPGAFVRRRSARAGLSAAFDEALDGVDGASFFLFCHDDVVLEPDTVRVLVSESFRSNAAIVGPKVVEWDDPSRLVQVGLGVSRRGAAVSRVEEGELDQAQHDEVREVFGVPGGCMLVRSDLFIALSGFDPQIDGFGEDVDLCWRAQVAGARIAIAPSTSVRHRQATISGERSRVDVAALRRRHELRSVLKNYGTLRRVSVVARELAVAALRALVNLAAPGRRPGRGLLAACRWNLAERTSLVVARRQLSELRQVSDSTLAAHMTGPAHIARLSRPVSAGRGHRPATADPGGAGASARSHVHLDLDRLSDWVLRLQSGEVSAAPVVVSVLIGLVILVGIRSLLFGRLPVVGSLVPLPPATTMLGQYFTGRPDPGWAARPAATPPGYVVIGLAGLLLGNSSALVLKLLLVSGVTAGSIGACRLVRPYATSRGRIVAGAVFAASPLQWNAMARGDIAATVALAGMPFLLGHLARSTGLASFGPGGWRPRALVSDMTGLALVLALVICFAPAALVLLGVAWACMAVAILVAGRSSRSGAAGVARSGLVVGGAAAGAILLTLPWSATWLTHGSDWSLLTGGHPSSGVAGPAAFLVGHLGPFGGWWGAFGLLVLGGAALLVASGEVLEWATRWWAVALGGAAFAWAGAHGWLGQGFGDSVGLSALVAAGLAGTGGLAATAFDTELKRHGLGWRQALGALAALALGFGVLTGLGAVTGGRSDLPASGYDEYLAWTGSASGAGHGARTLWVGSPAALPGASLQIEPGVAVFATTTGLPSSGQLLPGSPAPSLLGAGDQLRRAESGRTARLGALLAGEGIRYIVVPTAEAPVLAGSSYPPLAAPPAALVSTLQAQTDLRQRLTEAGILVFENTAWRSSNGAGNVPPRTANGYRTAVSAAGGELWREAGVAAALVTLVLGLAELVVWRRRGHGAHRPGHRLAAGAATT